MIMIINVVNAQHAGNARFSRVLHSAWGRCCYKSTGGQWSCHFKCKYYCLKHDDNGHDEHDDDDHHHHHQDEHEYDDHGSIATSQQLGLTFDNVR